VITEPDRLPLRRPLCCTTRPAEFQGADTRRNRDTMNGLSSACHIPFMFPTYTTAGSHTTKVYVSQFIRSVL
jgi:hypothetical protein